MVSKEYLLTYKLQFNIKGCSFLISSSMRYNNLNSDCQYISSEFLQNSDGFLYSNCQTQEQDSFNTI